MIELALLLVLLGLVGLLVAYRQTARRIRAIELQLAQLIKARAQLPEASGQPAFQAHPVVSPEHLPEGSTAGVKDTLAGLFERVVGGRLLIWIGGIALAVAGVFLVRQSIGLITPEARMIAAALLGIILIAAGEYARAGRLLADDPRIGQALVGAGIAIGYAAAYGSYLLFELIGSTTAAALMLLITAGALALSLRHGAPTAAMGLVGGFLTPLMVGDPQAGAFPVLAYLGLLDAAIFAIAWRRGWGWLAAAALIASFAWSGYFILESPDDALAAGVFAALLGIFGSLAGPRQGRPPSIAQPAIIALAELAGLVARSDLEMPAWLLFGGLAAAAFPISTVRPQSRLAPVAALLLALLLIAFKASTGPDPLAPIAALATTLLFARGFALLGKGRPLYSVAACAALAGPLLILRLLRPELLGPFSWGLLALVLALCAFGLLRLIRRGGATGDGSDLSGFAAGATAALLLAVAGHDLSPRELISGTWLVAAGGLLLAGVRLPDKALRFAGLLLLTATILKVFLIDAAALEGILRILSFLGLGVALIGIGKFYARVLNAEKPGGAARR
jgi:uncharacterized membrane protein